ncbi:HNH endonuclease [Candidatus Daviesbacteria bacterium]|nr:HNH endonuclease [Candidatus Daviesbacteria bacterium]
MAIEYYLGLPEGEILVLLKDGKPVYRSRKLRLFENSWGCEYPEGCGVVDIKSLTIDHFTPKSIAKFLGWNRKKIGADENCQLLCEAHHRQKDVDSAWRKQIVTENGGAIPMEVFLNSKLAKVEAA